MNLVTSREEGLGSLLKIIAICGWLGFIVGTVGVGLLFLLGFYVIYLFGQSSLIAHLKGNAVRITEGQFPDLFKKIDVAAKKLDMPVPEAYLMNGDGIMNAFATKFLKQFYVVFMSDVIDAFDKEEGPIDFYIGHELGHIHRKHLFWGPILLPTIVLPLLYPSYRRACEYTCDRYGQKCCEDPSDAVKGLSLLVTGSKRWKTLSVPQFSSQVIESKGFWMSFHELTSTYPWLSKRVAAMSGDQKIIDDNPKHFLSYFVGLFCPGFLSGSLFPILLLYVGFISAAIAVPALKKFTDKANITNSASVPVEWVNPVNQQVVSIPTPFKLIPNGKDSPETLLAKFSIDTDVNLEQLFAEDTNDTMEVGEYSQLLRNLLVSNDKQGNTVSEIAFEDINGVKIGKFSQQVKSGSDEFENIFKVWTHDQRIFWYTMSTILKSSTETYGHSNALSEVLVEGTQPKSE